MASTPKLCEHCHVRPRYYDSTTGRLHDFCGRTCANASSLSLAASSRGDIHNNNVDADLSATQVQDTTSSSRPRILFYHKHDPYYGFTNFSPHPVYYEKKKYPTSEHLFQSFKFTHKPRIAEHIRTCDPRPSKAFAEARAYQADVRPDWKQVNIQMMDVALLHKFDQHDDLRDELLGTGDAELVEDSDKDAFWGIGKDGKGRNELGKALERLRMKIRDEPRRKSRHRRAPRPFPFLNTILFSTTLLLFFWVIFAFLRVSPDVFSSLDIHRIFRSLVRL